MLMVYALPSLVEIHVHVYVNVKKSWNKKTFHMTHGSFENRVFLYIHVTWIGITSFNSISVQPGWIAW